MVRIQTDLPHTSLFVARNCAPNGELPSDYTKGKRCPTPQLHRTSLCHHPSACSGVKALRNTSDAKREAAKPWLAFRSLDPSRALREPDCRRRDEERPFRSEQKTGNKPKRLLDRKSPIQVVQTIGSSATTGFAMQAPGQNVHRPDRSARSADPTISIAAIPPGPGSRIGRMR